MPFSVADFQEILDAYYRKFPALKDQRSYLFLDEVQRIAGWEQFVRRVLDSEPLQVWVTGSSSKLLSTEIASSLRGRSLTTEIFPTISATHSWCTGCRSHSPSQRVRQVNPRKTYAVDTGLLQAMSLCLTEDRGAHLENLAYIHYASLILRLQALPSQGRLGL